MKVLAHIHTFNDADVIDRTIAAILQQTRAVDQILVVDNASTDGTLKQPALKYATIVRHPENRGTSGAVCSGFRFALEHGFDWTWIFDADSVPDPQALEKLLDVYAASPSQVRDETAFLACLGHNASDGSTTYSGLFTRRRLTRVRPRPEQRCYPCHVALWSGCLYRMAAVREIGLPNPDYFADWGEVEYGYRVMKSGYRGFTCADAVYHHNIRGYASVKPAEVRRGAATTTVLVAPPLRCYYTSRNGVYLSLYELAGIRPWLILRMISQLALMTAQLLRRPRAQGAQIRALFRGVWHGVTGNLAARF